MPGNKRAYSGAMKKASTAAWDRRWQIAISEYKRALLEFPQDASARAALALALKENGMLEESLKEYRLTRNLLPNDPAPLAQIAALQESLGRREEATNDYLALAEMYQSAKQTSKAIDAWRQAATLVPDRVDVHEKLFSAYKEAGNDRSVALELTALARIQRKQGDLTRAQILLQQALAIDPAYPQARAMMAELVGRPSSRESAAHDNPVEKARRSSLSRLAQTVFEDGPRWRRSTPAQTSSPQVDTDSLLAGAIDSQTHGRVSEAIDRYEQILRTGQSRSDVQFNLALLYKDSLRYDDAIALLLKTANDPQFSSASYFAIGECCRAQGKIDIALENFVQAMKVFDLSTVDHDQADQVIRVYESLAEGYRTRGADVNAEKYLETLVDFLSGRGWEDKVREVRRHLESMGQSGAQVNFAEVLELPDSEKVVEALGLTEKYIRQGHLVAAMDEALRAVELAPDYLPAHQKLAEILAMSGRKPEAREKLETLAETAVVRGDIARAVTWYRQALTLAPDDLNVRSKLIDLLLTHGRLTDALSEYLDLGASLERAGQSQKAIESYLEGFHLARRAGAVGPAVPALRVRLADAYLKQRDWKNALSAFQEVLSGDPEDERARYFLVELCFRLDKREQGEHELDELLSRNVQSPAKTKALLAALTRTMPNDVPLQLRLAWAYTSAGQQEKAIEGLDALGERLLSSGDRDSAIRVIQQIVALNPPRADDYRKVLDQLGAPAQG